MTGGGLFLLGYFLGAVTGFLAVCLLAALKGDAPK